MGLQAKSVYSSNSALKDRGRVSPTSLPGYPGRGVTLWIALNFADFRTLEKTSTHLSLPLNFADFRTLGETYICLV